MRAQTNRFFVVSLAPIVILCAFVAGCASGGAITPGPPPVPQVANLNNATTPSGQVGLPVEINGTGFQSAPGEVVFAQGSISATVTPSSSDWSSTFISAVIPAGTASNQFTVPGTVAVSVQTTGGTSNTIDLNLAPTANFNANTITWATTTPLPAPLTGLRAVVVPSNSATSAWVVITGGYNASVNTTTVMSNLLGTDGRVGPSWTATVTQALPVPLAHHAMVEADAGNSPVAVGKRYIYVLGGQVQSTSQPGGVSTVYVAQVNPDTGAVGIWLLLPFNLPQPLIGPAVVLHNGFIYVIGGLTISQAPSSNIYVSKVQADGTLSPWITSPISYPVPVAFPTAFAYAGRLYVLGGDSQNSNSPNVAGFGGINDVRLSSVVNGIVSPWLSTSPTIKGRAKHVTWLAFGQIIDAEGVYRGTPGSVEMEHSMIGGDGLVAPWLNFLASSNMPGANVFNATAIVSPLLSSTNAPRFLLFGGQSFNALQTPTLFQTVFFNITP
ncbi:MAG: hypothetical protein KGL59_10605 [Acidobacteriota bacterium]|nr:hypothetical protein [Acidobacteriota bacterium]